VGETDLDSTPRRDGVEREREEVRRAVAFEDPAVSREGRKGETDE
jgi:hypothetical protein